MSDYTPTTAVVRTDYVRTQFTDVDKAGAEFDRWLAGVKAQVWEEGYTAGEGDGHTGITIEVNPYRQGEAQ